MTRGVYSVSVSLVALLLVLPIAGTNQDFVSDKSELSFNDNIGGSRDDDYSVIIEFADGNEGIFSVTRNEEIQGEFVVTNDGTFDDTYDLSVTWRMSTTLVGMLNQIQRTLQLLQEPKR